MSGVSRETEKTVALAIQAWVEYSLPRGLAYAKSLLSDGHAAEDVVHDCFCRLLAKRDVYDLPRDGFKLLLRSITNACVDRGRKSMPVSNSLDVSESPVSRREVPDDRVLQPPREAMYRELEEAIGTALGSLTGEAAGGVGVEEPWVQSVGHCQVNQGDREQCCRLGPSGAPSAGQAIGAAIDRGRRWR